MKSTPLRYTLSALLFPLADSQAFGQNLLVDFNSTSQGDRGVGNDANWSGTKLQLIKDFIGIDTRTGSGGNGDWDDRDQDPSPTGPWKSSGL